MSLKTICFVVAMMTIHVSNCDGKINQDQRRRRNMEKPTFTPTSAPVTPSPTRFPTISPTDEPTVYPTSYPTEKKTMQRSPQAVGAPTSPPVVIPAPTTTGTNSPVAQSPDPPSLDAPSPVAPSPVALPETRAPILAQTAPPTISEITVSPTTLVPSTSPTVIATEIPSVAPSIAPSTTPSGSPVVSTNTPTEFPTEAPTYSNATSQMALRDFSILLLSFDMSTAINVGEVESTLESYMNQTMMLENLVDVVLSPTTASSAKGSNFTATSIRFAGTSSFIIAVPTQETLSITQDGIVLSSLSTSNIQKAFAANPNLGSISVVSIGYSQIDPNSVVDTVPSAPVDGEIKDTTSEEESTNNSGLIIGLVLVFAVALVGGALYMIRRRRSANGKATNVTGTTKPASARKMGESYYPSLRRHYPDIEKPKEESVNTPNEEEEEDDESSAADLSSYMMTPNGSCAPSTTVLKDTDKVEKTIVEATSTLNTNQTEERPTVEISVSHIEAVADDEDYTSTDDGSARFGATDMSECTFRG